MSKTIAQLGTPVDSTTVTIGNRRACHGHMTRERLAWPILGEHLLGEHLLVTRGILTRH